MKLEDLVRKTKVYTRVTCREARDSINFLKNWGTSLGPLKKHLRGDKVLGGNKGSYVITKQPDNIIPDYPILGLANELGELVEKVEKGDREGAKAELADVLFYVGACAVEMDCSIEEIQSMLEDKLLGRLMRGTIKGDGDNR